MTTFIQHQKLNIVVFNRNAMCAVPALTRVPSSSITFAIPGMRQPLLTNLKVQKEKEKERKDDLWFQSNGTNWSLFIYWFPVITKMCTPVHNCNGRSPYIFQFVGSSRRASKVCASKLCGAPSRASRHRRRTLNVISRLSRSGPLKRPTRAH